MTNKFAIYSGSTINSVPPKFYWKNQKYKNLFGYAKTLEEADKMFNLISLEKSKTLVKDMQVWLDEQGLLDTKDTTCGNRGKKKIDEDELDE